MKSIYVIIFSVFLFGCGEDFLDLSPETSRNSTNSFVTVQDIDLAVIGAYDPLTDRRFEGTLDGIPAGHGLFQASYLFLAESRSDNAYPTQAGLDQFWNDRWMDLARFRITTSNTLVWDTYFKCYEGISACNNVLQNIDNVEMDSALYNQYRGEVLFLRGFYYFHLVRNFGDVPITPGFISDPDVAFEVGADRRPVAEVYEQRIIPDLTEAAELLPTQRSYDDDQKGRVGSGTALGMLGKAELQRRNWSGAIAAFDKLIATNEYRLAANFEDIFSGELSNINRETMFEAQTSGLTPGASGRYATWSTFYETCMPTQLLKDRFYPGDLRLAKTIGTRGTPARDAFIKYPQFEQRQDFDGVYDGDNVVLLRYADILLMYAEASNELNGPTSTSLQMLNAVHAHPRTGLAPFTLADFPDQESFRQTIARERQIELAFEGHRWYDLLRYGQSRVEAALEALDESITYEDITYELPRDLLYPIPQIEVDLTGVRQNEGW